MLDCQLCYSDCCVDNEVRARAVQLLLSACGSSRSHQIAGRLMDALILKDQTESSCKNRYYGDSYLHRLKHRIMQSLLILEPLLDRVSVPVVIVLAKTPSWVSLIHFVHFHTILLSHSQSSSSLLTGSQNPSQMASEAHQVILCIFCKSTFVLTMSCNVRIYRWAAP